ncbi:MAG: hypothetical protein KAJ60_00755 [Desulfobulbaceae bacterium]|nr:hypothetical protein [Desulfobulbaceae bacterium]MCK5404426.1 hypothetical protein [Desulfobulbaceae bacterium]
MSSVIKLQDDIGGSIQGAPVGFGKKKTGKFVSYASLLKPMGDVMLSPMEELEKKKEEVLLFSEEVLTQARDEALKIKEDAYKEGLENGRQEGEAAGRKQFEEAIARVDNLLKEMQGQRAELNKKYEEDILPFVKVMVERLVNHEVSVNPLVIQSCLRKALEFVVENSVVKVHLHADDFNRVKEAGLEDPTLLEGKSRVQLIEDPVIAQGGCYLESDFGDVDATVDGFKESLFEAVDKAFLAALAEASPS